MCLTRPSSDIPGIQPQVLTKATPVIPIFPDIPVFPDIPGTFWTFQSFMTFQPFQAILQILHCSSISRESTPFQHSPTRMHILQFLQFDWFPQKLHRVPVEQYKLQTFYRHYILQRKGDVVISVNFVSVKIDVKMTYFLE